MKRCFWILALCCTPLSAQTDQITTRFKQIDTNGDGKLSADELKEHPLIQRLLKGADADNDGLLTLEEVRTHLAKARPKAKEAEPAPSVSKSVPLREGPKVLPASTVGVGRLVPEVVLKDLQEHDVKLKEAVGKNGLVIAFTNTVCPISKKYGPTLAKLEEKLASQGIGILYVNPTPNQKPEEMRVFLATHKLKGTYVHDRDGSFSKPLGVTTTTEVFLLDRSRTIVYRGAIDDQYGLGYSHDSAKHHYLLEAIDALLANHHIEIAATTAPGCELDLSKAKPLTTSVTYYNRIARIMQSNCIECHHTGGVGPFSLESIDDVISHAGMIRKVVEKGTMPPWFAAHAPEGKPTPWVNDRTLSSSDKADLLAWLSSDRPKGDMADAPLPRTFEGGWLIGKPDAVFQFEKPVPIKATGVMPYQNITIETKLTEDKWVKAVEVRPGARDVVHHVLVFVLPPTKNEGEDNRVEGRQGFFAIYVPGESVLSYPEGFAKKLPKGSRLRFQMHYTPNGTATTDRTQIGFVFAKSAPEFEVKVAGVANVRLNIPPGAENHPESAQGRVPANATILGFLPHMHLRGKAFRYEVSAPGGKTETILDIPRYDFNWQLYYRLAEPRAMAPGSTVKATGWFDNSKNNPANPDATKTVRWGPQTFDEMMLGYVEYFVPIGTPDSEPDMAPAQNPNDVDTLFKQVDTNNDGKISRAEYDAYIKNVPQLNDKPAEANKLFERLDADKDGSISPAELKKLRP